MRMCLCLFVLCCAVTSRAADEVTLTLARDGRPAATIVLAQNATRAAQFAAFELQWHLRQITGGEFAIVRDDQPVPGLAILVGDSQPVRVLGIDVGQFQKQEYVIRFTPGGACSPAEIETTGARCSTTQRLINDARDVAGHLGRARDDVRHV